MQYKKPYEITIDIPNPNEYCTDPESFILGHINLYYVGHCFGGSYIISVIEILRRSSCKIKKTGLNSEGYVDVSFLANVWIINPGDIIPAVKIINTSPIIVGVSSVGGTDKNNIVVNVNAIQGDSMKEGTIIPIRVLKSYYQPDSETITVVGLLLTCGERIPIFHIDEDILEPLPIFTEIYEEIKEQLRRRRELQESSQHASIIEEFEKMLSSYKSTGKIAREEIETEELDSWEGIKQTHDTEYLTNILTILVKLASGEPVDGITGYWTRARGIYKSSPLVSFAKEMPAEWVEDGGSESSMVAIEDSPQNIFIELFTNILIFMRAINDMAESYTPEIMKNQRGTWLAIKSKQI